ncbi:MAG: hypothetical protein AB7P37_21385, partial [Ramlibacter sp.]
TCMKCAEGPRAASEPVDSIVRSLPSRSAPNRSCRPSEFFNTIGHKRTFSVDRPPLGTETSANRQIGWYEGEHDCMIRAAAGKPSGGDFVVLCTVIRETVGAAAEARRTGFSPTFITSVGAYRADSPRGRQAHGRTSIPR